MEINSPPPCPNTVSIRRNPHRKARATPITNAAHSCNSSIAKLREVTPFPNEDILSTEIPVNVPLQRAGKSEGENIKVFLRVRPLSLPKCSGKVGPRAKNAWPQNLTKKNVVGSDKSARKKSSEICLMVNDCQSVTLSTPTDSQESKRIKSETYGGFSHVFPSDSSQFEVYERMVKPMVDDFLSGKSGMLAALGPSGSGKTHTVFGSPWEPGMVPLALKHIFKETESRANQTLRSYYISMFEIYSERGKAEKLFDLLPGGSELTMQQSTVKGLHEVRISDAGQAESLIAQAVLKRATAMTNTNSQSSRSQCIINVHQKCEGSVSAPSNSSVLSIIDLAGAEREKKTGNQGTRLLESNFINNTLMVFSLCLRSLLEHQKNPKKPLQKHFQSSLLTRYLRDYLEGKKRMNLVLTAKAGEEDYLDTSYLLRQASPYMKIKYNEVEPTNIVPNKRQYQPSSTAEHAKLSSTSVQAKRIRLISSEDSVRNEGNSVKEPHTSKKEPSKVCVSDANNRVPVKLECDGQAKRDRNNIIMQNFAKAVWNVLKQCNAKLKVAEMEIQSLKNNVEYEKKKNLDLEAEMNEYKASCTCCKGVKVKIDSACQLNLDAVEPSCTDEINLDFLSSDSKVSESTSAEQSFEIAQMDSPEVVVQAKDRDDPDSNQIECVDHKLKFDTSSPQSRSITGDDNCSLVELDHPLSSKQEEKVDVPSSESILDHSDNEPILDTSCTLLDGEKSERDNRACSSKPRNCNTLEVDMRNKITEFDILDNDDALKPSSPKDVSSTKACDDVGNGYSKTKINNSGNRQRPKPGNHNALEVDTGRKINEFHNSDNDEALKPSSPKDVSSSKACDHSETKVNNSAKHQRPKRRLMPSASILLRDLSNLDLVDETEKSKGSRGTRKPATDDLKRTNGSISLIRMLKSKW